MTEGYIPFYDKQTGNVLSIVKIQPIDGFP